MYCIITNYNDSVMYLAWQNPVFLEDNGYFWTWEDVFKKILYNNTSEHPFLFNSEEKAKALLDRLKLPQRCEIIPFLLHKEN